MTLFTLFHLTKYWPVSNKLGQSVYYHKIWDEFDYGSNRTRTVWVVCPWIRKFDTFDFVYTLSICKYWTISTKLGHNIYAHKVSDKINYGLNWIRTSGVICPWIWKSCWKWLCLLSIIYKYWPIHTKLGQNLFDHKISNEFDYGSNRTRTVWVICPWIRKFAIFDFVYFLASTNIDQSVPNLATVYMPIRSLMSLIMEQIKPEHPELFVLEFGKIADSDCLHSSIYKY